MKQQATQKKYHVEDPLKQLSSITLKGSKDPFLKSEQIKKPVYDTTIKGRFSHIEDQINDIAEDMNYHKDDVYVLKNDKDLFQGSLKSKHDSIKNILFSELNKVEEEMKRHFNHQKSENSKLQQQISQIKTEKSVLDQLVISLQKKLTDLEIRVGSDEDKKND